mmetsp:Transcript_22211/g.66764  ORF Transcript_22211/g.66764 Transcript_22211/m.66764 type:complete len:246 (+) Transcript_22211:596-1333(+)
MSIPPPPPPPSLPELEATIEGVPSGPILIVFLAPSTVHSSLAASNEVVVSMAVPEAFVTRSARPPFGHDVEPSAHVYSTTSLYTPVAASHKPMVSDAAGARPLSPLTTTPESIHNNTACHSSMATMHTRVLTYVPSTVPGTRIECRLPHDAGPPVLVDNVAEHVVSPNTSADATSPLDVSRYPPPSPVLQTADADIPSTVCAVHWFPNVLTNFPPPPMTIVSSVCSGSKARPLAAEPTCQLSGQL